MSTRPQFSPFIVIADGDMSADIISLPTVIQKLSMISYSITWSGTTPIGTMSVEVSNDFSLNADGSIKAQGTWNPLPLEYNGAEVSSIPVSGNTGQGFIDIDQLAGYAIRLIYNFTSGIGSLSAVIAGKVA